MDLRPYQAQAVEKVLDYALEHPTGRLLLVCPPGGGKTLIVATLLRLMAVENSLRGLVVAHRREMVDHHYRHLLKCGISEALLGVIMGLDVRENHEAPIQVASVDTLNRRNKPHAQVLVSDEAHRDASKSRRKLRALYPDAFRLGVTATPHRLDGKGLRADFDDMIVVATISELIVDGFLAAPKIFTVPLDLLPDLKGVRTLAGEYEPESLEKVVNRKALVGGIVEHWKRIARNRRTVAFAASIAHSKHIVDQFKLSGVPAAHLDQHASTSERAGILRSLETGELRIVSCVNILAEGWDLPSCKCVIQARPTMSLNLHIQQTGRCMRPWEAVVPLILDHAGNVMQHGLPQMDREWTLDGLVERGEPGRAPCKVCHNCGSVVPAGVRECPECANPFEHTPAVLEETHGTLTEFKMTEADKQAEMDRLRTFATEKGFSDAEKWARQVYQAKFGEPASVAP